MAHEVRMILRLNGANIKNSWENLEKEVRALEQTGECLSECSPVAADLKLLWTVLVTAVTSESIQLRDIATVSAIIEDGIQKLDLHRFVDGGRSECLRIRDHLRQKRLGLENITHQ